MTSNRSFGWPTRVGHPLLVSLLLSAGLHAAALSAVHLTFADSGADSASPMANTLQLRLAEGAGESGGRVEPGSPVAAVSEKTSSPLRLRRSSPLPAPVADAVSDASERSTAERPVSAATLDFAEPYYYPHRELDIPPYPIGDLLEPAVGESAYPSAGTVVLDLWIDDQGSVTKLSTARTDLPEDLTVLMSESMRQQRFTPAIRRGRNVYSQIQGELRYEPRPSRNILRR